jgi:hypothetical protein
VPLDDALGRRRATSSMLDAALGEIITSGSFF